MSQRICSCPSEGIKEIFLNLAFTSWSHENADSGCGMARFRGMPDGYLEHLPHSAGKPDPLPAILGSFKSRGRCPTRAPIAAISSRNLRRARFEREFCIGRMSDVAAGDP